MLKTAANVVQHSSCLSTFHLTAGDIAVALTGVLPQADILALGGQSKILGRCWDVLKVVTCLQSSLWASPHRPTQCSKTSLKMSDWKCEILTEPSNGQESYSGPREQGYLPTRC